MNKMLRSSLRLSKRLLNNTPSPPKVAEPLRNFTPTGILNEDAKKPTTVTGSEIEHHTKLMNEWWKLNGPMKGLHSFNLLRLPFVRDGLIQTTERERTCTPLLGKKILDIGCGGGILSEGLARLGAEVTGVDASEELIELAKTHSRTNQSLLYKPTYLFSTIEEHASTPKYHGYYDGVVASEVIEHIANEHKELFVKSCINVLKPGGRLFFTTPNRTRVAQLTVIYAAEYILGLVPRGTHQWELFTTPTELTFILERNGCHVEMVLGTLYLPTNKWQFVSNQSLMFALQALKNEL